MKILILIIASRNNPEYIAMIEIWRKYMNCNSNITSYFMFCDETLETNICIRENENEIIVKGEEDYIPGILVKTVKTIEYCLQNMEFDYVYRTNLSSFLLLDKLYEFIYKNTTIHYGGFIGDHWGTLFASGSGFFLSRDACQHLVSYQDSLQLNDPDDVAIGRLLSPVYGIQFVTRMDNSNGNELTSAMEENPVLFHYRCKDGSLNHENTLIFMKKLYAKFYDVC